MAMPLIDALPPAPTPADPEPVFDDKAYETVAALAPFVEQANALAVAVEGQAERSKTEADRSKTEADRSHAEASRAQTAADDAVAVTTGGTASIDPEAGKIPIAGADAAIAQAWIKGLEFELDALRVARNKALYADGPYPVLDLQFQGAKMLDPRVELARASLDWDEEGREYGVNEPVLKNDGLQFTGVRANAYTWSKDLMHPNWEIIRGYMVENSDQVLGSRSFSIKRTSEGDVYFRQKVSIESGKDYVVSRYVRFLTGLEEYRIDMPASDFDTNAIGFRSVFSLNESGVLVATHGGKFTQLKDGWYRIWKSAKAVVTKVSNSIQHHAYSEGGINYNSAPHFDVGTTPTPYIPTEESRVIVAPTRFGILQIEHNAVSIDFNGAANAHTGTGSVERNTLFESRVSSGERFGLFIQNGGLYVNYTNASGQVDRRIHPLTVPVNATFKVVGSEGRVYIYKDDILIGEVTDSVATDFTEIFIGRGISIGQAQGFIKSVQVYKE